MNMKFKEFLPEGDIRDLIALALVGAVIYLSITGQPIPDILVGLAGTATGYYFAAKENHKHRQHVQKMGGV